MGINILFYDTIWMRNSKGRISVKKNRLGLSELYVSEVGLGCMSIGRDEKKAERLLIEAVEQGINFFDTADLYDFGKNEEIVGKALKTNRKNIIIATKVGNKWNEEKDGWEWAPSKKYIINAVKESLRRLQTDYIDLYQLHGGTLEDNIDETIEAFEQLQKEGWIRYYGISSIRPNVIREYVNQSNIVSVMVQYSLLDRRPEEEILPLLANHHISAIARGPLAKGVLSGNVTKVEGEGYLDYSYEEIQTVVRSLQHFSNEERTLGQVALKYPLTNPTVATVIPGASHTEQLIHNAQTSQLPELTKEEWTTMQSFTQANRYDSHR